MKDKKHDKKEDKKKRKKSGDGDSNDEDSDASSDRSGGDGGDDGSDEASSSGEVKAPEELRTVFVRNLLFETTESSLSAKLSEFGKVEMCKIVVNKDTKLSKGCGFVRFTTKEAADEVLEMSERGRQHDANTAVRTPSL